MFHTRVLMPLNHCTKTGLILGTLTYGRGPPGPVVNGVLRTPDGVVTLMPKAMLRLRNAVSLLKLLVRAPPLTVAGKPIDESKIENLAATESSMMDGTTV